MLEHCGLSHFTSISMLYYIHDCGRFKNKAVYTAASVAGGWAGAEVSWAGAVMKWAGAVISWAGAVKAGRIQKVKS